MNDDIEKINEQNKNIDFPAPSEGDFSQAKDSSITTNEEDNKKSMAENIILDLGNQRQDIDFLKETCKTLLNETNDIKRALNQITQVLNQSVQGTPQNPTIGTPQGLNMESLSALGDLLEKGVSAYKNLKGTDNVVDSFTQQITDNAKAEAIESLNIVHLINKKVKGKLVQDIAGDIAGNVINDSNKQNSHAPQ